MRKGGSFEVNNGPPNGKKKSMGKGRGCARVCRGKRKREWEGEGCGEGGRRIDRGKYDKRWNR